MGATRYWRSAGDFEFRISNLTSSSLNPPPGSPSRCGAVAEGLVARGAWLFSPRQVPPAPSTHHNQPRRPSITPTSRKASPGVARRGFPRAGGRGVGAGKWSSRVSPGSNVARRRAKGAFTGGAWHPDSPRIGVPGILSRQRLPGHKHGRAQGKGQSRGRRPWPAGGLGAGYGFPATGASSETGRCRRLCSVRHRRGYPRPPPRLHHHHPRDRDR